MRALLAILLFCSPLIAQPVSVLTFGAVADGIGKEGRCQFLVGLSERRLESREPGIGRFHRGNLSFPAQAGKD